MNRLGEAVFALLLFVPLMETKGFGTDMLRLPIALLLVGVLMGRIAWSLARRKDDTVRTDPLRTATFVFVGAVVLSLIPALDRWDGVAPLLALLGGVGAYLVLTSGCLSRAFLFRWAMPALALSALLFAACAIGQSVARRPATATVGNTNYAGAFSSMLLPFVLALAYSRRSLPWHLGYFGVGAALFVCLILTESRGGLLGAAAGLAVAGGAIARHAKRPAMVLGMGVLVVALGAGALLWKGGAVFSRSETVRVRLGLWKGATKMTLDSPVRWFLGTGLGNFRARFPPYRRPEEFAIAARGAGSAWPEAEDAHSLWVHLAAETGIVGLLAWLLVLYVGMRLWRFYVKTAPDEDYVAVLAGAGGGIAAFLTAGFFNSLHLFVAPMLFFWIFLGLIEQIGNQRVKMQRKPYGDLRIGLHAAAVIVGLFGAYVTSEMAAADFLYHKAVVTKDDRERNALLEDAMRHNFRDWRVQYELGALQFKTKHFPDAASRFKEVLDHHPNHVGALNYEAEAVYEGEADWNAALDYLNRAIGIAPYYYLSYKNRGVILARAGHLALARESLVQALEKDPSRGDTYYLLGALDYLQGDHDCAAEELRQARAHGCPVGEYLRKEHPEAEENPLYREFFKE